MSLSRVVSTLPSILLADFLCRPAVKLDGWKSKRPFPFSLLIQLYQAVALTSPQRLDEMIASHIIDIHLNLMDAKMCLVLEPPFSVGNGKAARDHVDWDIFGLLWGLGCLPLESWRHERIWHVTSNWRRARNVRRGEIPRRCGIWVGVGVWVAGKHRENL
jgi:hypothetical protein